MAASSASRAPTSLPPLFVDLDGVLADFDGGVVRLTTKNMAAWTAEGKRGKGDLWGALARAPGFFERLEWMPRARAIWAAAAPHAPTILTGLPLGTWAAPQKRAWCARELGAGVPVITCMAREKAAFAAKQVGGAPSAPLAGAVLIDDNADARAPWEAAGGVFVHHIDVDVSLRELAALGFVDTTGGAAGGRGGGGDEGTPTA
jgi:hypothetical protein